MKIPLLFCAIVYAGSVAMAQGDFSEHIAALQKDPLKMAAFAELGNECGTLSPAESKRLAEQGKILTEAGPAVIPALVYLVSDRVCSPYFVGNAAEYATQFPYSEPLRAALRARRDDKGFDQQFGWYLGVFKYLAAFGDQSDLAWMEATSKRMSDGLRPDAAKFVQQLRERLSSTSPTPNHALQRTEAGGTSVSHP